MAWSPALLPPLAEAPRSLPRTGGQRPGCGAEAEVDRGRARWAWPEGVARREAGPGRCLSDCRAAAAAAEAAGWRCARVGRRLGSGGSACGAAARPERPPRARQLQRGRRGRGCAPRGAGRDPEQVIPAGTRSPPELAGRAPPLPGAAAAAPPRRVADGAGLRTWAREAPGRRAPKWRSRARRRPRRAKLWPRAESRAGRCRRLAGGRSERRGHAGLAPERVLSGNCCRG